MTYDKWNIQSFGFFKNISSWNTPEELTDEKF